jgi:hypothetical protein
MEIRFVLLTFGSDLPNGGYRVTDNYTNLLGVMLIILIGDILKVKTKQYNETKNTLINCRY